MGSYPALDLGYPPGPGSADLLDLLHAALDDFHPLAITEHETADGWRVFFPTPALRAAALAALRDRFGAQLTHVSSIDVPDEEWARRSQAQLTAVQVGRIVVAPPWDVPASGPFDAAQGRPEPLEPRSSNPGPRPAHPAMIVVIDPSMGFGTGHHETTRLCLRLLQEVEVRGQQVIDVGTGSGVLALAAWKLGARHVVAVDSDRDALANARANIERNGASAAIEVVEADLAGLTIPPAGVVAANLTGAVIQRHAAALAALVATPGTLVVSGFSPAEVREVTASLGMPPGDAIVEGAWAALTLQRHAR